MKKTLGQRIEQQFITRTIEPRPDAKNSIRHGRFWHWRWWLLAALTCCAIIIIHGLWLTSPIRAQEQISQKQVNQAQSQEPHKEQIISEIEASSVASLLARGQQFYDAAQFSEAVSLWQQASEQAGALLDVQQQAIAQNYLSIGHQSLGNWDKAAEAIAQAKVLLQESPAAFLYAQVLNTEGNLQIQTGQTEAALATWTSAEPIYRSQSATAALVRNQINQAHALRVLGHYRQARQLLETMTQELSIRPDSWLKAQSLQNLGITLRAVGDLSRSQLVLSKALYVAEALPMEALPSKTALEPLRLSLAKTLAVSDDAEDIEQALALAQQVRENSDLTRTQIEAALLQFRLGQQANEQANESVSPTTVLFSTIEQQLSALPPSRWGIYAQVDFVAIVLQDTLQSTSQHTSQAQIPARQPDTSTLIASATLLANAIQQAQILSDVRAQSYALGALGHVYEQNGQWSEALSLTRQALRFSQQIQATDMAAKWQWQLGRLLSDVNNPQKDLTQAIAVYSQAVQGLEAIQTDLVAMNPEVQFSFREQIEPVYRQLVRLLLKNVESLPPQQKQQRLEQSRQVIESLQLAELQNYFRETCLTYEDRSIETIDPYAAVIYPILLDDRVEVIVSLPGQPLQHHGTTVSKVTQLELFKTFYGYLNPFYGAELSHPPAQQLYDWLIRPFEAVLEQQSINTLVFVPDGFLRSLPMSALYDGKQYLLEKYRTALTPGMQLLSSQPLQPDALDVLTIGLSEPRDGFSAIPAVEQEITSINQLVDSRSLLNSEFTKQNFFNTVEAKEIDILHLATHGQFSSSAEDTFLLAWDGRINVKELGSLLKRQNGNRQVIELMVLSACQTASGDDRAALGIAGFAVRSGARSTLATLWSVNDESTSQLMTAFYNVLTQANKDRDEISKTTVDPEFIGQSLTSQDRNITRSEALRQAQLSLLNSEEFSHPYFWSPFVMVGNWQ